MIDGFEAIDEHSLGIGHVAERQGAFLEASVGQLSIDNPVGHREERHCHIPELERGVGTRILNHLAQKYHGTYEVSETGDQFHTQLTLMAQEDVYASDCSL